MSDWRDQPPSSAHVKIVTANNASFFEAFQFDPPQPGVTPPTWTLYANFRMDIKAYHGGPTLLSFTSGAGQIIIDDPVQRIIHTDVPESTLTAVLIPGSYIYDLIMFDTLVPPTRVPLMHGEFILTDGVTGG